MTRPSGYLNPRFNPIIGHIGKSLAGIDKAKLGLDEEVQALKRLDDQARQLERTATGPSLEVFISGETSRSAVLGGRSVFRWKKDLADPKSGSR